MNEYWEHNYRWDYDTNELPKPKSDSNEEQLQKLLDRKWEKSHYIHKPQIMEINKIYTENCLDTMAKMDDNFIQSIITSPPYFNLRDYGNSNQIGIENSFKDYLNNLLEVFTNAYRILKDDGILFYSEQ